MQKNAFRIILKNEYSTYKKALIRLEMENLYERREKLCLSFARKCLKNPKTIEMFPINAKSHNMKTRNPEKYLVQYAQNERSKKSPIIYMQKLLNANEISECKLE